MAVVSDNGDMTQVTIEDMQRELAAYLKRVEAGETFLILRAGQPVAEVKPPAKPARTLRPSGLCAGEFQVPADFDEALPEELLRDFEGA
jgi:antitoxin (DNA-binding transcriptional repressor) of toxin-antitoxin stability system